MTSGLPELYIVDEADCLVMTDEGKKIQNHNSFRYLDFLRHQFNEQLHEAYRAKEECERSFERVSKKFEKDLREAHHTVSMYDATGWTKHPCYLFWDMPDKKRVVNRVRILEASRDLVVGRMNAIGSRMR